MNIYSYEKAKNCFIIGGIGNKLNLFIKTVIGNMPNTARYKESKHPKAIEMESRLTNEPRGLERPRRDFFDAAIKPKLKRNGKEGYANSVIIVNGSNVFGGNDLKYYYDKLEMLNNVLADNNVHILFVRGSDDPEYFEKELINLSNIKTIKDYSVIKLKKFNCLCIGGQISMDRSWKKKQEERIGKRLYWENEKTQYNEEALDEIIRKYTIACVITPTCPSFAQSSLNTLKKNLWASDDKELVNDISVQMGIMDSVYHKMTEHKPYVWLYSKTYNPHHGVINDIVFYPVDKDYFTSFQELMSTFFRIKISETLQENNSIASSFDSPYFGSFSHSDLGMPQMQPTQGVEAPRVGGIPIADYANEVAARANDEHFGDYEGDAVEEETDVEVANNAFELDEAAALDARITEVLRNAENTNGLQEAINDIHRVAGYGWQIRQ